MPTVVAILDEAAFVSASALYEADALVLDSAMDVVHEMRTGEDTGQILRQEPVRGLVQHLLNKVERRSAEFARFIASDRPIAIILRQRVFFPDPPLAFDSWYWWSPHVRSDGWIDRIYADQVDAAVTQIDTSHPMAGAYIHCERTPAVLRTYSKDDPTPWFVVAASSGGEPVCIIPESHPNVAILAAVPTRGIDAVVAAVEGWAIASRTPVWQSSQLNDAIDQLREAEEGVASARRAVAEATAADERVMNQPGAARAIRYYKTAAAGMPEITIVGPNLYNMLEISQELVGVGQAKLHTVLPVSSSDEGRLRQFANKPSFNARHASLRTTAPNISPERALEIGRAILEGLLNRLSEEVETG